MHSCVRTRAHKHTHTHKTDLWFPRLWGEVFDWRVWRSISPELENTHRQTAYWLPQCANNSAGISIFFFLTPTSVSITATPLSDTDAPLLLFSRIVSAEAGEDRKISTGRCNTKADWVQNYRWRSKPLLSLSGPCLMTWEVTHSRIFHRQWHSWVLPLAHPHQQTIPHI